MRTHGLGDVASFSRGEGWREAIRAYLDSPREAASDLWRLEVALYLQRTDEARRVLARADVPARPLYEGEVLLVERLYGEAATFFRLATYDAEAEVRARIGYARCQLRLGNLDAAIEEARRAARGAARDSNRYLLGIATYVEAYAHEHAGRPLEAEVCLRLALDHLSGERLRWYACAANLLGGNLTGRGHLDTGLALIDEAERIFSWLGSPDVFYSLSNAVAALVEQNRFREAITRGEALGRFARDERHPGEILALYYLARAYKGAGDLEKALRAADECRRVAELVGTAQQVAAASDAVRELEALRGGPIRVTGRTFTIDLDAGWASVKDARDEVERFLLDQALAATDGDGQAAGRLIGWSKSTVSKRRRSNEHVPEDARHGKE